MSGRAKRYAYHDTRFTAHGEMRCYVCHQPITAGQYRTHETPRSFVNAHRACTSDDPAWAKLDAEAKRDALNHAEFVQACIAFRDRWGVSDLDDYITDAAASAQGVTDA